MIKLTDFLNSYNPNQLTKPYIIAEAGVNHEGSMDLAKRLIDEAAEGGAHAIKFQTYKAETIASKDSPYYWDITKEPTRSQFELFKKYCLVHIPIIFILSNATIVKISLYISFIFPSSRLTGKCKFFNLTIVFNIDIKIDLSAFAVLFVGLLHTDFGIVYVRCVHD
jgi:hypothetical protein